jgi:hypothetical protein
LLLYRYLSVCRSLSPSLASVQYDRVQSLIRCSSAINLNNPTIINSTAKMPSAAAFLALATVAVAQSTTTLTLLAPMVGPESLVGSVVTVGPSATVYAVECPSGSYGNEDEEDNYCAFPDQRWTMTQGPETWEMEASVTPGPGYEEADEIYQSIGCHFDVGADSGTCSGVIGMNDQTSTMTEEVEEFTDLMMPVVITAGAEKLANTEATTTGSSSGSETTASSSASDSDSTSTGASETVTETATGSTTAATTAATTDASNDNDNDGDSAAGTISHNAFLVGVAAVIGGFALL